MRKGLGSRAQARMVDDHEGRRRAQLLRAPPPGQACNARRASRRARLGSASRLPGGCDRGFNRHIGCQQVGPQAQHAAAAVVDTNGGVGEPGHLRQLYLLLQAKHVACGNTIPMAMPASWALVVAGAGRWRSRRRWGDPKGQNNVEGLGQPSSANTLIVWSFNASYAR